MIIAVDPERLPEVVSQLREAAAKRLAKPTKADRESAAADGMTWEVVAPQRIEALVQSAGGNLLSVDPDVYDALSSDKGIEVVQAEDAEVNPLPDPIPAEAPVRSLEPDVPEAKQGRRSASSDTPPPTSDAPDSAPVPTSAKATPRPRNNK